MLQRTQSFCGFYLCVMVASVWAWAGLITDHPYGRGTPDNSNRPFPSEMQPEFISARKTHKHKSNQASLRSAKSSMRKSTSMLDWEQQELQVAMELRQRIAAGYRYKHYTINANNHDHAIDAVFVGYQFSVEERQRLRSAHVDNCLAP